MSEHQVNAQSETNPDDTLQDTTMEDTKTEDPCPGQPAFCCISSELSFKHGECEPYDY